MYFSRNLKRADHLLRRWAEEPIGVAVPFLAFLAVWLPPQMPDMFAGMEFSGNEADPLLRPFLFAVSATLLGLSAWFWTRAALTAQRDHGELDKVRIARGRGNGHPDTVTAGEDRRRRTDSATDHEDWSHEWAPRIALLAAGGITLLPILFFLDGERLLNSPLDSSMLVLVGTELLSFGLVGLLFVFVVHRTRFRWIGAFDAPAWMKRHRFTRIMAFAPFGWPFAVLSLACSLAVLACVVLRPEWVTMLDAPTAAIASLAFAVGPLVIVLALFRGFVERVFQLAHIVSHRGRMRAMIPGERHRVRRLSNALGTIAMLAWFLSPPWVMEKHPVPLAEAKIIEPPGPGECNPADADEGASGSCRPDLETALRTWVASRRPGAMSEQRLPVIIVAAEGGASRAAAWLLSSLRMLDHQTGGEAGRHLFAISGVSGGSLGAVSHLRLVAAHADAEGRLDWDKPEVQDALSAIATSDLLSATISTYFLSDMFGSMVGPLWTWSRIPDRNAALERSFDLLWQRGDGFRLPEGVPSTLVGLHAAMAERRVGQASLPHVILNGSDVSTGRRILTSSIRTTADLDYFPDSGDFIKLTTHDISLATAVTNSARFPFVSPAGSFWSVTERKGYQIIDGGYFENYGARTAWELARAIEDLNAKDPSLNVVPVVVIVSNDLEAYQPPAVKRGECRPQLGDIRQDGMQITVRCDDHVIQQACTEAGVSTGSMSPGARERSLVPQSLAPFLGLASTRSSHGRDALNIVKRDFCRAPTPSSDVPATRMIHIALPIPETVPNDPQNAVQQSAPMNWVLNPHACNYMMNVAPWIPFNRTQALKLEATMAAIERRAPAKARTDVPSIDCGLGIARSGQKPLRLIAGIP
jgi:hypothetical protein